MSQWTHVCGCIRTNCGIKKEIVRVLKDNTPCGSEGPIRFHFWQNPRESDINNFVISIWGDLRDYSDIDEIKRWFDIVCSQWWIGQAVITIEVEFGETQTFTFQHKY